MRSSRAARMYEPGPRSGACHRPPLLMVVALNDTIAVTDLALAAYEGAREPQRLVPGGHVREHLTG